MPAPVLNSANLQTDNLVADLSASSLFTVSTVVDASKNLALVVPFLGLLEGTSTATMNMLDISQNTSHEVHALFKAVLDLSESIQFLSAFQLIEGNAAPTFSTGNTLNNQDLSFNVLLDNSGEFAEVLAKAMSRAVVVAGVGDDDKDISAGSGAKFTLKAGVTVSDISNSAAAYMREKMRDYVVKQLLGYRGPLASILIASNLKTVAVTLDASSGSADMATRIVEGSDPLRKLLLSQIPAETLQHYLQRLMPAYTAAGTIQPDFLPMKGGDAMTFVFVTKVTDPDNIGFTSTSAVGTDICSNAVLAGVNGSDFLNGKVVRRIGFSLQLGDKQAFFPRDICSASIPMAVNYLNGVADNQIVNVSELLDLSQALIDASENKYASGIPYKLSTAWSTTAAGDITTAQTALATAATALLATADTFYDASANAALKTALGAKVAAFGAFVLDASAGLALRTAANAYNKKMWEYVILTAKKTYEDANRTVYSSAAAKSWDAGLVVGAAVGAVAAKTGVGSTSNGM